MFDKITKLPRREGRQFNFGRGLHGRVERHLLKKDPFEPGWEREDGLSLTEALDVESLFKVGLEERSLPLWPEYPVEVELNFCVPTVPDMSLPWNLGFIDMCSIEEAVVTDWKTSSSWRWVKTPDELASNIQMNIYAKVVRVLRREQGLPEPDEVTLQHGVFLKKSKWSGKPETEHRTKLIETRITPEQNDDIWHNVIVKSTKSMMELALDPPEWYDLEAPPIPSACDAFGGCDRIKICKGLQSLEEARNE